MFYERSTLAEPSQFTALAKAIRYARFRRPNEKRELSAGAITGNADLPSGRGMGKVYFSRRIRAGRSQTEMAATSWKSNSFKKD
jgi:hypothetical protein